MGKDQEFLKTIAGQKILVAGDLMLDRFVYGDVDRISPEGPVPVLAITDEKTMLGGLGNVISNLHALKCTPVPFAIIDHDFAGQKILDILKSMNVSTDGIMYDSSRPTTIKTRYIARSQQLLRTDIEKTHSLSKDIQIGFCNKILDAMKNVSAIILSDYGKGCLNAELISLIIAAAKKKNIPVLVDPKGSDYSIYRGANIITPNRKELSSATNTPFIKTDQDITLAATKIIKECDIDCVIATRSEDGLSVVQKEGEATHIPTTAKEVFDVSGAGDTVIATIAALISAKVNAQVAAKIANVAGGIAVSKIGTTPVGFDELFIALEEKNFYGHQAIHAKSFDDAAIIVQQWQAQGHKVGLTNGCFDIVHAGHVNYINQARGQCDKLILALNHDQSVRILKGPTRPVNDQNARATVIGGLGAVDMVVFFGAANTEEDNTPCALVNALRPNIFFKGGDYTIDQLPEGKIVQSYGGEVAIMAMHEGFSTTSIIEKSQKVG